MKKITSIFTALSIFATMSLGGQKAYNAAGSYSGPNGVTADQNGYEDPNLVFYGNGCEVYTMGVSEVPLNKPLKAYEGNLLLHTITFYKDGLELVLNPKAMSYYHNCSERDAKRMSGKYKKTSGPQKKQW